MTRDELWKIYTKKNPSFEGEGTVTLSRAGLRKMFDQVYEKGHEQGVANGRALEALKKPDNSLFARVFGPHH